MSELLLIFIYIENHDQHTVRHDILYYKLYILYILQVETYRVSFNPTRAIKIHKLIIFVYTIPIMR